MTPTHRHRRATNHAHRSGGADARRRLRAAGRSCRSVQPGMRGGQYRPLSNSDIQRIYDTALDILQNIEIGQYFEGILIDNDMIGNVQRIIRGIEVNDETLSYDLIRETVYGAGHYLGNQQTLELMQSEYLYPEIADRDTPGAWEETGHESLYEKANRRVKEMMRDYYPEYISPEADRRIRKRFPIRLNRNDMQPDNGRW